ncbi:MAG: hypothetical protein ABIV26_00260, partial [Candidatus Limnocylindrales bacterium]
MLRTKIRPVALILATTLLSSACSSAPSPVASAVQSTSVQPSTGEPSAPPSTPIDATAAPGATPKSGEVSPVRQDALELGLDIRMVPAPDGSILASIPRVDGSVLLMRLDAGGRAMAGWPVELPGARACETPFALPDASVRIACRADDLNQELNVGARVFAFDAMGIPMPGWPVDVDGIVAAARVIGNDLVLVALVTVGDVIELGVPTHAVGLVRISPSGRVAEGVGVPRLDFDSEQWRIGPDGIAYGTTFDLGSGETSRITAVGPSGASAGAPMTVPGFASAPALGPHGLVVLAMGSLVRSTIRIARLDPTGATPAAGSAELPADPAEFGDTGGCGIGNPETPIVSSDGSVVLLSWARDQVFAVDSSLVVRTGWPYQAPAPFMRLDPRHVREDAFCQTRSVPAVGPDGTIYLALQPRDPSVGSSIVALGPDGGMRAGWPVQLRQAGAEFWSIAVG